MKSIIIPAVIGLVCLKVFPFERCTEKSDHAISSIKKVEQLKLKTWGDSMFLYAIEEYLPPSAYRWNWRDAVILRAVADIFENNNEKREIAFHYMKDCVVHNFDKAHSRHPNGIASAFALPLLYKETGEKEYMDKAIEMYKQYMQIPRAYNGGVSHRADPGTIELWDDTIYMIGLFFLEMYKVTNDEKYLQEFIFQVLAHDEKLADPVTGFWYHGWDNDNIVSYDQCCQDGWSDNPERRNHEFWGRGNGWIAMALADCLEVMSKENAHYPILKKKFTKMIYSLLPLQDEKTGHWRQLPVHVDDADNYIESSCSVMFGYAIAKGINIGILPDYLFEPVLDKAYYGIETYSIVPEGKKYRTIQNVCEGTCIGDKEYYYARQVVRDTEFAVGGALLFDNIYRKYRLNNK